MGRDRDEATIEGGPRRLVSFGAALAAVCCGLLIGAPPSAAGIYEVRECYNGTGGSSAPDFRFTSYDPGELRGSNFCPPGSTGYDGLNVHAYGGSSSNGQSANWRVWAPAGTYFSSVTYKYSLCKPLGDPYWVATWIKKGSTNRFIHYSPDNAPNCVGPYTASMASGNADNVGASISCGANTCFPGGGGGGTYPTVWFGNFRFTLYDGSAPRLSSLGGSLLSGGPRAGAQRLEIRASDSGAGVREASIRVNRGEIAHPTSSCALAGSVGTKLKPCPRSQSFALTTDTERGPWHEGFNTVSVCVTEFATLGSPAKACSSRTIVIDNTCVDSEGSAGRATAMVAGLDNGQGELRPSRVVRSLDGATIRGTLVGPGGAVGGANVCLYEQIDAPAEIRRLAQVTKTRSDGTFALQVPPGPSRVFDVVYRHSGQLVEKRQIYLDSAVVPDLKIRPKRGVRNGRPARFLGAIPGPHFAGRVVALQAKAGRKWRTFKVLRTDEQGRFKGRYRFTQTRGTARYRFRATVKKQNGYPYSTGRSKVRKVKVRGPRR